jgi:hypothetical protein
MDTSRIEAESITAPNRAGTRLNHSALRQIPASLILELEQNGTNSGLSVFVSY